tara:strand:+ start:224 stop:484 length:261 start_codon:yes stop_codon:yes gene_type:complete
MLKEIKYLVYIFIIFFFFFFTLRFYFSEENKKNYFRQLSNIDKKIKINEENIITLKSDTENIIEYVESNNEKGKNDFKFWELLQKN